MSEHALNLPIITEYWAKLCLYMCSYVIDSYSLLLYVVLRILQYGIMVLATTIEILAAYHKSHMLGTWVKSNKLPLFTIAISYSALVVFALED